MAVLSDKTIKERIAENKLIPGGDPDRATHCSYEFTAASILRGGSPKAEQVTESVVIEPAQLVWIRAREEISIPPNMVGLWIQTQKLARDGLLLLNISLIEPGYKGPLSAVLVNFGKEPVPISPRTKIAKVMFLPLDGDAANLVEGCGSEEYNDHLAKMALAGPTTFLQLQAFDLKADDILDNMKKRMKAEVSSLAAQAKDQLGKALKGDIRIAFLKWGGPVLGGLVLGCAIVWLMISSYLPRLSEYGKFDELARRAAMTQQAETITGLNTQFELQKAEIEALKKQFDDLKTGNSNPQSRGDATDTTSLPGTDNVVPSQ